MDQNTNLRKVDNDLHMDLNVQDWKEFRVGQIFQCETNSAVLPEEMIDGNFPYITRSCENNGCCGKLGNIEKIVKGNCITVGAEGILAFYQPEDFISGIKVYTLRNDCLNMYNALFVVSILNKEYYKYSYGRARILEKLENEYILLPADSTGNPDWQYMEDYIKSLHHKKLTTQNKVGNVPTLNVQNWKEFRLGDLISDIYKAKAINKDDLVIAEGNAVPIRYITRTGDNNGCELLVDKDFVDASFIEDGNAITIGDTTATCFYQANEFITGDHMVVIRAEAWLNKYTGLFIVAMLTNEQYKYSYGRAFLKEKIKDTILKLPTDSNGNPDWQFMEDYIKALPYGDKLSA